MCRGIRVNMTHRSLNQQNECIRSSRGWIYRLQSSGLWRRVVLYTTLLLHISSFFS
jgi:hypothetical protein